jgi:hypothetical protein
MLPRSFPELKRMLTISKALSAGQAQTYHYREFASEQQNYWSRDRLAYSEWRGALAEEWSLRGSVQADHFARLSEGQHPESRAACQAPACEDLRERIRQGDYECRTSHRMLLVGDTRQHEAVEAGRPFA